MNMNTEVKRFVVVSISVLKLVGKWELGLVFRSSRTKVHLIISCKFAFKRGKAANRPLAIVDTDTTNEDPPPNPTPTTTPAAIVDTDTTNEDPPPNPTPTTPPAAIVSTENTELDPLA